MIEKKLQLKSILLTSSGIVGNFEVSGASKMKS